MDAVDESRPVERRLVVTGRVQGVGYRWFARETARALGVAGWACNMPDGSVVLEIAGPAEIVARFTAELQLGPPTAQVAGVRVSARASADPLPERFTVVR
ncbi:MAG TPA: acylphosphatase [Gemmatimonadaceae bacterium]|nr:acylphosphatase [Gemmatimonadaceae bacterium]